MLSDHLIPVTMKPLLFAYAILLSTAYPLVLYAQQVSDPCGYITDSTHRAWCLMWYRQDSIRRYWDSVRRNSPPKREDYYLDIPIQPLGMDSASYKRFLQQYLKDSAIFYQRRQHIDSIKNIIYDVPRLAYALYQRQTNNLTLLNRIILC